MAHESRMKALSTSNGSSRPSKRAESSTHLTSSFGFRFHQAGKPNVYFRTEPDLTSDPDQVWVALDTSEIRFENHTPESMAASLDSDSTHEENLDEAEARSPKRQKTETALRKKSIKSSSAPMGFRVDKPVKIEICDDVWRLILKESLPTVLLILRNANRVLRKLLQEQSIWKASRENLHGSKMPGPPGEMTEQRYADLLYGQGCDFQRSKCGSSVTKKVYWPFLLRMCDACFRRKVEKDKAVRMPTYQQTGVDICELITAGMTSSGKYTRTRRRNGSTWDVLTSAVYLRTDFEATLAEYRQMVQAGLSTVDIDMWKAEKMSKAEELMLECEEIEEFQKGLAEAQPRHREARADFFATQAANLTPPMNRDVMEKMMAFKMSLDSNHKPTLRSWGDLKKKLLPHCAAAENLLDLIQQTEHFRQTRQASPAIEHFQMLHNLRSRQVYLKPLLLEQAFVMDLGRQQLTSCQARGVADADLLLLVLKGVFDSYQALSTKDRPRGTNTDLSQGPYRLTLDDARMIVQDVIEPEVKSWDDNCRIREALESFKCVACVRKDCTTRYNFDKLFQHLLTRHAIYVAEGEDFDKLYRPFDHILNGNDFPWYTVEWPKNLPVAASHHFVSKEKKWLADAEVAYIPAVSFNTASAFHNRRCFDPPGIDKADLEGNLTYAAAKLRPTTLNVMCQMRIALQFAVDRFAIEHGTAKPSLSDFMACLPNLQEVNEDFTLTFSCGVCKQNPHTSIPQSAKHTRPESLTKLKEHFVKTHGSYAWIESLMHLPSDTQLASILIDTDEGLRKEKRATEERQASLTKNPRKKADPNAKMILQRPEAMAVFDELFPKST